MDYWEILYMSVRTKGRRKIIVENKLYVWYVRLDDDSIYHMCNIISEDKSIVISCPIKTEIAYIICKGIVFQNHKMKGNWERYLLPFAIPKIITPNFVSKIILWAVRGKNAVKVIWNGKDIPI